MRWGTPDDAPSAARGDSGRRRSGWSASLLAAVVALAGCVRVVPPPDLSRDPTALLQEVRAAQERVQRVRGSARVRVSTKAASGSYFEIAIARKPDSVRLETLDFFGNPAAVLVASEGRFALLDLRENVYYRGAATPENVSRFLPVVLPVDELVTILCGSAPILPGRPLEASVKRDALLLTLGAGELGQRLTVGARAVVESSRVRGERKGPEVGGAIPGYDLDFAEFRELGGTRFPTSVILEAPAAEARVDLTWRADLDVNGAIDASAFRLEPPRGARVVDLDGERASR